MSRTITLHLDDQQAEQLEREAQRTGRDPNEVAMGFIVEFQREQDFAYIEFRSIPRGRQVFLKGSRLAVWQVVDIVRAYDGDVDTVACEFNLLTNAIRDALAYAEAFPAEIEDAISNGDATVEELRALIPDLGVTEFSN